MRRLVLLLSVALAAALLPAAGIAAAAEEEAYIVVLRDGGPAAVASDHARAHGARVRHVYSAALRGYAARMTPAAAERVARDRRVAYVEVDREVTTMTPVNQANPTWGLDRIDQRALPRDNRYTAATTGSGVTAYVLDTGIRLGHVEFGNRLVGGFDAVTSGGNANDCNGHGTHVAGTIGGTTYGVAKSVSLSPIRVLDCNGSGAMSGVIAGVDWVTANHRKPAVANMSLGGGASTALDDAVRRSISAGVTYAVAAGNGDFLGREQDACGYSPARVSQALTIGATTSADAKTSWSNYGSCVDLFAPGASITSAWHTSTTATNTISGTSMATPHVAGAAALFLETNRSASPSAVASAITSASTKGIVTSSRTANNHLLFSRFDLVGGGGDPAPPPPGDVALSIAGSAVSVNNNFWRARATATTSPSTAGVTVAGSFSNGGGSGTCTTGADGRCAIESSNLRRNSVASSTFTVSSTSASSCTTCTVTISRP